MKYDIMLCMSANTCYKVNQLRLHVYQHDSPKYEFIMCEMTINRQNLTSVFFLKLVTQMNKKDKNIIMHFYDLLQVLHNIVSFS